MCARQQNCPEWREQREGGSNMNNTEFCRCVGRGCVPATAAASFSYASYSTNVFGPDCSRSKRTQPGSVRLPTASAFMISRNSATHSSRISSVTIITNTITFPGLSEQRGWGHRRERAAPRRGGTSALACRKASTYVQARRLKKSFLFCGVLQARLAKKSFFFFGHLFFNITNVFCAKQRAGHTCICPRMVTS